MKIHDIWVGSGGYEQTNVTFYRVAKITKTMVTLEAIASETTESKPHAMRGTCEPLQGIALRVTGKPIRRKVKEYDGKPYVAIESYSMGESARPWDGMPARCSWYG